MRRYYFHLRDGHDGYVDSTGTSFSSDDAAREHAQCIALDLMKNREVKARHWRICVRNRWGEMLFEVPFITLDRTLSHLSPPLKKAMEGFSQRCYALRETIAQARTVQIQARALVAKSRGKPYLAADRGDEILSGL